MGQPHPASCARQVRSLVASEGASPWEIALVIHRHCGVHLLRAQRLARGWALVDVAARIRQLALDAGEQAPPVTHQRVSSWETGRDVPSPRYLDALCRVFETRPDRLGFGSDHTPDAADGQQHRAGRRHFPRFPEPGPVVDHQAWTEDGDDTWEDAMMRRELLRRTFEVVGAGLTLPALQATEAMRRAFESRFEPYEAGVRAVDRWEQAAQDYGFTRRTTPPPQMLGQLVPDFSEILWLLNRRLPLDAQRRLRRVAAQFATITAMVFNDLGRFPEARRWLDTALLAADETGDRRLRAWVLAKDAVLACDFHLPTPMVIQRARQAQAVGGTAPSPGVLNAMAIEARALGQERRVEELRAVQRRAESVLARLEPEDRTQSMLAMSEQQMRFYFGRAYRLAGDLRQAEIHWRRAAELYPKNELQDPALLRIDRACGLVQVGDVDAGCAATVREVLALPPERRVALVASCAREPLTLVPAGRADRPAVRDLRDLLQALPATAPS